MTTERTICPKCGSTERSGYTHTRVMPAGNAMMSDGRPATHLVLRYTRCKCGQMRIDRFYERRV